MIDLHHHVESSKAVAHLPDQGAASPHTGAIDGLNLRRLGLATIVGLLLLRTVLLFVGDGVTWGVATGLGQDPSSAMVYANVFIVPIDLITLGVLYLTVRSSGGRLRDVVGPVRWRPDLLVAIPVTLVLGVGFVVASFLGNLLVYGGAPPASQMSVAPPLWLGIWSITIMPITVALAEELLYRGVALHALADRFGTVATIVLTALFFGLQHASLSTENLPAMLARVITTTLAGVLFAVLAVRLRRLLPLIIGHWALDVLGLGLPMLLAGLLW